MQSRAKGCQEELGCRGGVLNIFPVTVIKFLQEQLKGEGVYFGSEFEDVEGLGHIVFS